MELRLDNAKDVVECTRNYIINGEPMAVRTPDDNVYFLAFDPQGRCRPPSTPATVRSPSGGGRPGST
ncbi:hypothetical protein [Nonomuraea sp. NPDC048901]|uniref:hypothetical protein n=1 Tax=Nonomuraea sp. NPDC048901 TaxID=3155627 RepID=UPI0033C5E832